MQWNAAQNFQEKYCHAQTLHLMPTRAWIRPNELPAQPKSKNHTCKLFLNAILWLSKKHAPKQTHLPEWQNWEIVAGAKLKYIQNQM